MSDPKIFDKILTEIIRQEKGITKCILTDKTGLTIANVSKLSYYPVDVDSIGAIASAVFCASEEQGKNLQIGDLEIVTSEFSEGKIFASACGKGVLSVVSKLKVNKENLKRAFTPEIFATDEAYKLVKKGIPFREAYRQVAKNIHGLKSLDPDKSISSRKHLGAAGNLGLEKIEKKMKAEWKILSKEKKQFDKKKKALILNSQ